jgi:hypothetical protein
MKSAEAVDYHADVDSQADDDDTTSAESASLVDSEHAPQDDHFYQDNHGGGNDMSTYATSIFGHSNTQVNGAGQSAQAGHDCATLYVHTTSLPGF